MEDSIEQTIYYYLIYLNNLVMKKFTLTHLGLGFAFVGIISACAETHIYKGERYYEHLAYAQAIPHLEKVYFKSNNADIGTKLADSYFKTGKFSESESVYRQLVKKNESSDRALDYARVLMNMDKHEEAEKHILRYLITHKSDESAKELLKSCYFVNQRYRDTSLFRINEIQTPGIVNAFSVTEINDEIVFVGDREVRKGKRSPWTGESFLDVYSMGKDTQGDWGCPRLLTEEGINGKFHEGPVTFSEDQKTIYFTRSNYIDRKMELNDERENNLKIYSSKLVQGNWSELSEFPFNSDDYSVGHPCLASASNEMFFISDMPGGLGGTDIYKSKLINGKWSQPENLGDKVNSTGNEMFPFMDESNNRLYFSSDAHNTMGGLDVFMTYYKGNDWSSPQNMNYPINSTKDDFGFIYNSDSRKGFLSSSRSDNDKIYEVDNFDPTFNLIGFTHEKGTMKPIEDVEVEIIDKEDLKLMSAKSDESGGFIVGLSPEKEYSILCTKPGFYSLTDVVATKGYRYSKDFYADFEIEWIEIDAPIVLENIYYDFDLAHIRPDAALELDKLVKLLNENPMIDIEMGSHTDLRGTEEYNFNLSDDRAHSAVQYLIRAGIAESRLSYRGYGEAVPRNHCREGVECSDEEHEWNRRTEFKVTHVHPGRYESQEDDY